MNVGTAPVRAGEIHRGYLTVTDLPTGAPERLPVVTASGDPDGPTLWITGGVHGDEATGLAVAQDVPDLLDPDEMAGTLVSVPAVNPAGVRRNARTSYYRDEDPNRRFPDPALDRARGPTVQELIDARLYEQFADAADALVDCHTATVDSVPYVIRDRVLYGGDRDRDDAAALADDLDAVASAAGLPVVTELTPEEYTERGLQRSTAGAALNAAGIPAVTLELGSPNVVGDADRAAGVAAVCGVAAELGVVDNVPDGVDPDAGPSSPVEFPVRRAFAPRAPGAGVVRHRVAAGERVQQGDVVADVVAPHGEHRHAVECEREGYVLGRQSGVAVYENDPVTTLAVRDDTDLVAPRGGD